MFCPKCGKSEQVPNGYCRSCGEWLPNIRALKKQKSKKQSPQNKAHEMMTMSIVSAIFAVVIAILSIIALSTHNPRMIVVACAIAIGFAWAIVGMQIVNLVIAYEFWQRFKRRGQSAAISDEYGELNEPALANNFLPAADTADFAAPASVTENTTRLFEPVKRKRAG